MSLPSPDNKLITHPDSKKGWGIFVERSGEKQQIAEWIAEKSRQIFPDNGQPITAADLGGGDGDIWKLYAEIAKQGNIPIPDTVYLVDRKISSKAKKTKEKYPWIKLIQAEIFNKKEGEYQFPIPFQDKSLTHIFLSHVLAYLPEGQESHFLKTLLNKLKKEGIVLVFAQPHQDSPLSLLKKRLLSLFNKQYSPTRWTKEEIEKFNQESGASQPITVEEETRDCSLDLETEEELYDLIRWLLSSSKEKHNVTDSEFRTKLSEIKRIVEEIIEDNNNTMINKVDGKFRIPIKNVFTIIKKSKKE